MEKIKIIGKKVFENAFAKAFLLSTLTLVFTILFCDIKYAISDDFITAGVLSGAFTGEYNPHMLFSNVILGHFLVALYSLVDTISFYFVYIVALAYFALLSIEYVVFKKNNNWVGWLINIALTAVFVNDLFVQPTFTHSASVAVLGGGVLLVQAVWNECKASSKLQIVQIALSVLLLLGGALLRFSCVYIVVPFIVGLFFIKYSDHIKEEKILPKMLKGLGICAACLALLFGVEFLGGYINSRDPEIKKYGEYNQLRSGLVDKHWFVYDDYDDWNSSLGLDENDYYMLGSWSFMDRGIYTDEIIQDVGQYIDNEFKEWYSIPLRIIDGVVNRSLVTDLTMWTCIILSIVIVALDNKSLKNILIIALIASVMLSLFFCIGRAPYRITYSIFLCMFVCLACCTTINIQQKNKPIRIGVIALTLVLTLVHCYTYIPDSTYKTMDKEEYEQLADSIFYYSGERDNRKYRFVVTEAELYDGIIDYMENDSEHYYMCAFQSTIQRLYYHYKPWERLPKYYWRDNYMYLGGCTMQHPDEVSCLEYNGIDPDFVFGSILDSNIYVVDNDMYGDFLDYYHKYYSENVKVELVNEIDGFHIWRFYTAE